MSHALTSLSLALSHLAELAAPKMCAIRTGQNQHITGLVCAGGVIVTVDQALPAQESYSVILPNGLVAAARPGQREPGHNLAMLHLEAAWPGSNPEAVAAAVGSLVVVLAADSDASPMVRLTIIRRLMRSADGPVAALDLPADRVDFGSLILDPEGRLIGLGAVGSSGDPVAIDAGMISRLLQPAQPASPPVAVPVAAPSTQRGWLGVALQPITVPNGLALRAGQSSGRMVVSLTRGGPAEQSGLRIGDVVLKLNGTSACGPHALRAFLTPERIGSVIDVKLLRDGSLMTTQLTVEAQP